MFDSVQRIMGCDYSRTVAWLLIAIVFIPAVVLSIRPGYVSLSLALMFSAISVIMDCGSWRKSRLTIPTIAPQKAAPQ